MFELIHQSNSFEIKYYHHNYPTLKAMEIIQYTLDLKNPYFHSIFVKNSSLLNKSCIQQKSHILIVLIKSNIIFDLPICQQMNLIVMFLAQIFKHILETSCNGLVMIINCLLTTFTT